MKKDWCTRTILGVKVDCIWRATVLKKVAVWVKDGTKGASKVIVTPNPEMLVAAQKDKQFKDVLNKADIAIPDGVGLVWALKRKGCGKVERVAGADVMMDLIKRASSSGWRVFMLGGGSGVVDEAIKILKNKYPRLKVAGVTGPINIERATIEQNQVVRRKINRFKPHLLLVAFGHQKQENWIVENLPFLKVEVAMGVGGSFDYLVKPSLRAPKLVQDLGFEWLWRLVRQPWRVKRQLQLVKFVWLVLTN